jgi:hypothetical protein
MNKIAALTIGILLSFLSFGQSFDKRSPFPLFMSSSDLKKLKIKTISLQTYNYDDPENYSEQYIYGIDKTGKKSFFTLKMYKSKLLAESNTDTTFFTKNNQTGYECSEQGGSTDTTLKEVCDSNHRVITRGSSEYGNFERYEYGSNGKIINEYLKLSRVDRVPTYKRTSYQYDKLGRLIKVIYYEGDITGEIDFKSETPFNVITFKMLNVRNIYFIEASQRIKYIEEYDTQNKLQSLLYYHYSKSGLHSYTDIFEVSPKKRLVAKSQFKYTYY